MIAWVDLETTGISSACAIIEFALVITDEKYKEFASYEALVLPPRWAFVEHGALTMHNKSGLWDRVHGDEAVTINLVDAEVAALLARWSDKPMILAGSSVHFDRGFIEREMPFTKKALHYRNLDVSTIKMFVSNMTGIDSEDLPPSKETRAHTAMSDILDSIDAIKWYTQKLEFSYTNKVISTHA